MRHHAGVPLGDDLPSHTTATRATYAARAAQLLLERHLLTPAFLDAWMARVPAHAEEIRALQPRPVGLPPPR